MNQRELTKLRKALPKKGAAILGERLGMHPNSVYRHLFNKRTKKIKQKILDAAIQLAEETQETETNASEKIKKL
jgi:hypothetical protein